MAKKNNRVVEAIIETAGDMHRLGMLDDDEYSKSRFGILAFNRSQRPNPSAAKRFAACGRAPT